MVNSNQIDIDKQRLEQARVAVRVERHLQSEVELLRQLENLNQTLSQALSESGSAGLTNEQSKLLGDVTESLLQGSTEIRKNRTVIHDAIAQVSNSHLDRPSIRQFIQTLPEPSRHRIECLRSSLLDRLTDVHASMLGNQAVMFYTYDFNCKMVDGLLGRENEDGQYGNDGQSAGIKPGNLIQRAC